MFLFIVPPWTSFDGFTLQDNLQILFQIFPFRLWSATMFWSWYCNWDLQEFMFWESRLFFLRMESVGVWCAVLAKRFPSTHLITITSTIYFNLSFVVWSLMFSTFDTLSYFCEINGCGEEMFHETGPINDTYNILMAQCQSSVNPSNVQ